MEGLDESFIRGLTFGCTYAVTSTAAFLECTLGETTVVLKGPCDPSLETSFSMVLKECVEVLILAEQARCCSRHLCTILLSEVTMYRDILR